MIIFLKKGDTLGVSLFFITFVPMKRIIYTLSICCLCTVAAAAPISSSRALQVAAQFLSRHGVAVKGQLSVSQTERSMAQGRRAQGVPPLYLVNNPGGGFVIVAGDDCAGPVLGYSTEGNIDAERLADNLGAWLADYEDQMADAAYAAPYSVPEEWAPVEPMLTTQWNQGSPYNAECPTVGDKSTWAGCVATAMAQIMFFWQWPQAETDSIPAYTAGSVEYDSLAPTTFDWENMIPAYNGEYTPEQVQAVAHLMHYAGRSVEMTYGVNGSSAYVYKCPDAFISRFGYDSHVQTIFRNAFSTDEWNAHVYSELAKGHPVLYSGQSARVNVHAFVCDGYDGQGFFHINWGFGGNGNGWFRLQALNLQERRTDGGNDLGGYTFYQRAVIGIQPPSDDFVVIDDPLADRLFCDSVRLTTEPAVPYDPAVGINDVTMYYRLYSEAATRTRFLWGVGLYKDGERLQRISLSSRYLTTTAQIYTSLKFNGYFKNLEDGVYRVVLLSRSEAENEWHECYGTEQHYLELTIADGTCSVRAVNEPAPIPQMEVVSHSTQQLFQGDKALVHAVYTNVDEEEFRGPLYLLVDGTAVACEHLNLAPHATDSVDFYYKATRGGTVNLVLAADRYGATPLASWYEQVNERAFFANFDVQYADAQQHLWLGLPLNVDLTLTHAGEGDFVDRCSMVLSSQSRPDITVWSDSLRMYPSERKVISAQMQGNAGMCNTKYVLRLLYSDGVEAARTDSFLLVEAVPCWRAGGIVSRQVAGPVAPDVLALDLTWVKGHEGDFQPNENPNTLYYMGGDRLAAAFSDRNCVISGHASELHLTEGHGFYVPMPFTADEASFHITPLLGTDGHGGWFSMVLPFQVDEVYNVTDQRAIDWFRNTEDSLKDFWVKELFLTTDDGRVAFKHAETWTAGMPYIVAVPDGSFAPDYLLQGKELRFTGRNVALSSAAPASVAQGNYIMRGAYTAQPLQAYFLNAEGTAFEFADSQSVPFGCWIEYSGGGASSQQVLSIWGDSILAVQSPCQPGERIRVPAYSVDGRRVADVWVADGVADLSALPRGVFIIKGRKYVK